MEPERKFPVMIPVLIVLALILGLGSLLVIRAAKNSRATLQVLGQVPQFSAIKQNGDSFSLENLKGKISIVDFIFTNCQGICPPMSANMARLYNAFEKADNIQFISISVDPARDTLTALQQYASSFEVDDDRWVFLWMPVEDVVSLSENGFKLAADDLPTGHSSRFILVDSAGQIRGYYDGTDDVSIDKLADDIGVLAKTI